MYASTLCLVASPILPFPDIALLTVVFDTPRASATSDIVIFLYRDDYYNEDTEKKNVAEVILAKHRGGSTGTVELLWLGNYTKFANLEKHREEGF